MLETETETEMTRIPPGIDSPKMGRTGYGMHVISFRAEGQQSISGS
jgi:hypothetical protein